MAEPSVPLLETKLHAPRRRGVVARPRLRDRLDRRDQPALTLVSAAAGFGKTTLVAEWFADGPATAWLSLDARDNDPRCSGPTSWPRSDRPPAGGRRRDAAAPASRRRPSTPSWPPCSTTCRPSTTTSSWCSTTTTSSRRRRSTSRWPSCSTTCPPQCTWSSPPAPTRRCPWPRLRARGRAAGGPRRRPPLHPRRGRRVPQRRRWT